LPVGLERIRTRRWRPTNICSDHWEDGIDVELVGVVSVTGRREEEDGDDDRCQVGPARQWQSKAVRFLGSGWTGWWAVLVGFGLVSFFF
jgi:hypothetical protein